MDEGQSGVSWVMVQITVPTQKEWIRHARQGFDHRVGHCEVLHMLVECMGGNAYTLIGDPADVETIQSRYAYLTPRAGELTDGPQRQ